MIRNWEETTLGEIGKVSMCKRILKNQTNSSDGIPFYKIGTFGKTANAYISEDIYNEFRKKYSFPKKGDILLSASGTIGRRVVYDGKPAYFQDSNIVWIDNNEEKVLNDFLYKFYGFCDWNPSKGATISRLYNSDLRRIKIPIPPIEQQKQIVKILDKSFEAIEKAKKNIETNLKNAKELFDSKLNEIFSQKGEGWDVDKIENLTTIVTKGSSPKWQGINYADKGILFVTSENVGNGALLMHKKKYVEEKFNEIQKKSILKEGDVLTNIVGASIGRTAIFNLNEIANINQAVCIMRCNNEKLHNYYLMNLLNSPYFKEILHSNEVNNARANLSLTFFKNLIIHFPNLKEQIKIVKEINILKNKTKQLEQKYQEKLNNLEELKKSLLQKAFSGELTN